MPLLSLHMIVKNEAASIEAVLESVRPFIDTWDILDTGSTDGTQELIKKTLAAVPGRLHEESFVAFEDTGIIDFGATRQRSLDLAEPNAEWTFWLSGDEYLRGGQQLRDFCEAHLNDSPACHVATVFYDSLKTDRHFLFRAGSKARWRDPIHEWVDAVWGERVPEDVFTLHTGAALGPREARYARDLIILKKLREREPNNHRYAYYLAQTFECLGMHAEAARTYADRVAMGGWDEEVYSAAWIGARELASSGAPWSEALERFLDAHERRPSRAEALFEIASHYAKKDKHALAFTFAKAASEIPLPHNDSHFIQQDIYTHRALEIIAIHAYYCGQKSAGKTAAKQLVRMFPDNEQHRKNLAFYSNERTVKIGEATVTLRTDRFGDEQIFHEIVEQDDYRLASMNLPDEACVIDAGCQVGIFSATVCDRFPSAVVVGVELDAGNADRAKKNLAAIGKRAIVIHGALVGSKIPKGYVPAGNNTGGHTVSFEYSAAAPIDKTITLAEVALAFGERIDLLKMDIESAEHDVLALAAKDGTLDRIDRIAMEWHAWNTGETLESLRALLEKHGFIIETIDGRCANQGMLFAKRHAAMEADRRFAAAVQLATL